MQKEKIINNKKLAKCINYAIEAHKEQKDYSGIPYIVHLVSVMNGVDTVDEKIVAILHDIIEDTEISDLKLATELNLPIYISKAIYAITHIKNESNEEYIKRVKNNKLATKVKIADLQHNMDLTRMINLDQDLVDRLNKKHVSAYKQLMSEE